MSSFTILGATGNCGTALLNLLLQSDASSIKVYCRTKEKLVRLVPQAAHDARVQVYTGSILDVDLFAKAVRGSQAVFLTASTNDNIPGCHISQDLAKTVIKALEQNRAIDDDTPVTMPKLVLLSSATIDPWISRKSPWINAVVRRSAWHVYHDLELAEDFLRSHEDWVTTIYIKPGGLSVDAQRGHKLSLDDEESFVSYLDIAAGMIEAGTDKDGKWDLKNVGVVNAGGKAKFPPGTPRYVHLPSLQAATERMLMYLACS